MEHLARRGVTCPRPVRSAARAGERSACASAGPSGATIVTSPRRPMDSPPQRSPLRRGGRGVGGACIRPARTSLWKARQGLACRSTAAAPVRQPRRGRTRSPRVRAPRAPPSSASRSRNWPEEVPAERRGHPAPIFCNDNVFSLGAKTVRTDRLLDFAWKRGALPAHDSCDAASALGVSSPTARSTFLKGRADDLAI